MHPGKCPAATTFQDGIPFFSIKVAHLSTRNNYSINFCADLPKCPFRSVLVRIGERMGLLRNDARDLSPLLHDHCRMITAAKTMEPADSRPDHEIIAHEPKQKTTVAGNKKQQKIRQTDHEI